MTVPGLPRVITPPVSPIDRSALDRDLSDGLAVLAAEPGARVLLLRRGRAPLDESGAIVFVPASAVAPGADTEAIVAFLGRDATGPVLLALLDEEDHASVDPAGGWAELREVGGALGLEDAAFFVEALSLARWIRDAAFCPACGTRTELRNAGWSRHCPSCGREHFPRTDPAVIVAVTDGTRLLLGSNAAWPEGRYSCFAGFVEAGESAEESLVREIEEESGVRITAIEYVGSQAWPYPRSLMLGYLAFTENSEAARPDGSEIVDVRWFEPDEVARALAGDGDVTLPGPSSISRGLIEQWLERVTER
ncbi:MAG: NAD(+) diphosphatase [Microbacterium sp.]|uniref:NAD(+) diphosphatase n=1 Tax=Microbacterium sp. TaxID=51671 RepID=UPI002717CF9F|nr:NAD(+) diphosphatase [Microbacterium sp.]MDO8381904.1 NAD(+) diphosphatase [Microbacterium sp.]